jgi:hypothetical protein
MIGAEDVTTDFYTWATLTTLAGATAATFVVGLVAGFLLGDAGKKWAALVAALAICIGALLIAGPEQPSSLDWFIAILNGLLVFASALGFNQMAVSRRSGKGGGRGGIATASTVGIDTEAGRGSGRQLLTSWVTRR